MAAYESGCACYKNHELLGVSLCMAYREWVIITQGPGDETWSCCQHID